MKNLTGWIIVVLCLPFIAIGFIYGLAKEAFFAGHNCSIKLWEWIVK